MALELPSDLIQQVKISTRNEAGLPEYNPDDPSLPAMPSISATVAAFDPSPPYLRCNRCKGKLLRGLQSLICIYCGQKLHRNPNDVSPEPISFKSTVGYQWFLQALRLDGSEKVGAATEKNQVNKGPSSPHDEILLSDLLDLKIKWPTEPETDCTTTNKKPEQNKSSYNSTGIDLDNFLCFSKREDISSVHKEQAVISDNSGAAVNKTVGTHEDLSLFENLRSSEPAVTSATIQTTDDFSGWEADFQGADSGEQNVSNTSSNPTESAVGSATEHVFTAFDSSMSSTVGSENQLEVPKPTDAFVGTDIDLSAQLDTVFGTAKGPTDGKQKDAAISPAVNDWPAVDLWDGANSKAPLESGEVFPVVRSKDDELQNSSNDPSTSTDWFQDDTWQTHSAPAPKQTADHDSFDEWDAFTSSAPTKDPFENAPAPKHDTTNGDHDSFDEWNTFTSSAPIKDPFENVPAPKHDTANEDHDTFDEWNTFTSPAPIKDPFENVVVQNNNDNTSNTELTNFSSNLEDMDFGSFSQSDPFSGAPSKESVSGEVNVNIFEAPTIFSDVDTPSKVGDNVEHALEKADSLGKSNPSKDHMDIEDIMSQMHDLSFMLETNLSIPSKSNTSLPRD